MGPELSPISKSGSGERPLRWILSDAEWVGLPGKSPESRCAQEAIGVLEHAKVQ